MTKAFNEAEPLSIKKLVQHNKDQAAYNQIQTNLSFP